LTFFAEAVDVVAELVYSVSSPLPSALSSRTAVLDPAIDVPSSVVSDRLSGLVVIREFSLH
jgi:hypothetical protein